MDPNIEALFTEFPSRAQSHVQWGEMDSMGHVNNTIFFRWFENGRITYFRKLGLWERTDESPVAPILASVTCHFRRQVKYPDSVWIGCRIGKVGNTSLTMEHRVVSEAQQTVVAEGQSIIVVFNYEENKPIAIPADIRASIERLEGPKPAE